ncbi:MAG: 3-isopropylmalate dehydratase [Betaproteobacteria bacterium]|nr:3-isopropylmalate dehydratase [Betaproteobacteria bacterium]
MAPHWHRGKAWFLGDNIDTDQIMPTPYLGLKNNEDLAKHVLSGNDPGWPGRLGKGDILFAGLNFGCGSSREHAPRGLKGAGIACVVARSFARIFYRNAINIGLPLLVLPQPVSGGTPGQDAWIDLEAGAAKLHADGPALQGIAPPQIVRDIIAHDGLMPYVKAKAAAAQSA